MSEILHLQLISKKVTLQFYQKDVLNIHFRQKN